MRWTTIGLRPRQALLDRAEQPPVSCSQEPPPSSTSTARPAEVQPRDRDPGERDDLGSEPLDDLRSDLVVRRLGEYDRRELDQPPGGDPPTVNGLGDLERCPQLEVRGTARSRLVHGPAPSSLRAAAESAEADVVAAAPVAGDGPERWESHLAAVRRDADTVDAYPQTRRPPSLARCRRAGRRTCRCRRSCAPPSSMLRPHLQLELLGREVDARRKIWPISATRSRCGRALRSTTASSSIPCSRSRQASRPRWCGEDSGPRTCASSAPSARTSARSVFELPPSTARTTGSVRRRPPAGRARAAAPSSSTSSAASVIWPISGCVSSAFRAVTASRGDGCLGGQPLVRGDVLDEPEELGEKRCAAGAAQGPSDSIRAGKLDDVVVGEPGDRTSLRTSTTCTSPVPAASDATSAVAASL